MHAPHGGGGEFHVHFCFFLFILKPHPSLIARTSVKRLAMTRFHMWRSMW